MVFIGIDPGKTGSITVLDEKEGTVNITSMPKTIAEMQDVFDSICSNRNMNELYAVLEQVHSMPGQGVASSFTFGIWLASSNACRTSYQDDRDYTPKMDETDWCLAERQARTQSRNSRLGTKTDRQNLRSWGCRWSCTCYFM